MIGNRCLAGIMLILVFGCGDSNEARLQPGARGPFTLALEVDFLDAYGPITVEIEGKEPFSIHDSDSFSCENSPLVIEGDDFSFEAISERFFYWNEGPRALEGGCITLSLGVGNLATGVVFFYEPNETTDVCFPLEYRMTLEGRVASLGAIQKPWTKEDERQVFPLDEEPAPFDVRLRKLLEKVREGKAVMGGGWREPTTPYELLKLPPDNCPMPPSTRGGFTPIRYGIFLGS